MSDIEILSPLYPPADISQLEEEIVSNGFLPDIRTGLALEFALWHLAGLTRSHGFWLGAAVNRTVGPESDPVVIPFLLKPWARYIVVHLLFDFDDEGEFEIEIGIVSRTTTISQVLQITGSRATRENEAQLLSFDFGEQQHGDYPGQAANRDEGAYLTIGPNGADLRIWSATIEQLHTALLVQDSEPIVLTYEELILTTGTEGQEAVIDTGAIYTYSEVTGTWIRKEAYSTSDIALVAKIDGDVVPTSETPAWSDATSGGTVTSDGTRVTWQTLTAANTAGSSYTHSVQNEVLLFEGRISAVGGGTDSFNRAGVAIIDNTKLPVLNLDHDDGGVRIVNTSNVVIGTVNESVPISSETFVELLIEPGGTCYVWFDHAVDPALEIAYSALPSSSSTVIQIGNFSTNGIATIIGRGIKLYRMT